jgi:hypothetical protein
MLLPLGMTLDDRFLMMTVTPGASEEIIKILNVLWVQQ